MAARKELLAAAGHYAAQAGLDERLASAEKLQALALALSPQALKAEVAGAEDAVVSPRGPMARLKQRADHGCSVQGGCSPPPAPAAVPAAAACCRLSLYLGLRAS